MLLYINYHCEIEVQSSANKDHSFYGVSNPWCQKFNIDWEKNHKKNIFFKEPSFEYSIVNGMNKYCDMQIQTCTEFYGMNHCDKYRYKFEQI